MISDPATNIDASALCGLLQLSDTFYPTGAYAHSYGLEGLVDAGVVRDRETLREFLLAGVLPSLAQTELPLVLHTGSALKADDWDAVGDLCVLASALRTPKEIRSASDAVGHQRIDLLVRLRAHPLAIEFQTRAAKLGWPSPQTVAAALESAVLGTPIDFAMAGIYYSSLAGILAAAMKVLRLGQNGSQSLLTELLGQADAVFAQARRVAREDIGWSNPWLDIASARHENAAARLFIS